MSKYFLAFLLPFLLALRAGGVPPAAPTFQELMDPPCFTTQRGLQVESLEEDGESIRIRTTGADITLISLQAISCFINESAMQGPWPCCGSACRCKDLP